MGYCVENDVKLNLDNTTYTDIIIDSNSTLITDLITYVSSLMDGVLAKRYSVPILNSYLLKDICVKLVICRLYDRRGANNISKPEPVIEYCKQAELLLNDIANGNVPLFDNTGQIITADNLTFTLEGGTEVFTDSILSNYVNL